MTCPVAKKRQAGLRNGVGHGFEGDSDLDRRLVELSQFVGSGGDATNEDNGRAGQNR